MSVSSSGLPIRHESTFASLQNPFPLGVEEGYKRWAATYDGSPNPLLAREERYLEPLLPPLQGKRVLDLACGTGRWLQRLRARGTQLGVGVDLSSVMLQVAAKKHLIRGQLLRADCLQLPFPAAVFDFAICSFAVGHVQDLRGMAGELARVLKPKADLWITDLHYEAYALGWRAGFRDGSRAVEIETFPRRAEGLIRTFHTAGFECLTHVTLCLGEAEETIFAEAGKRRVFAEACRVPAVLACHFRCLKSG